MKTKIDFSYNKPSLYIDGNLTPPVIYALSDFPGARSNTYQAIKNIENFKETGVNLVAVDADLCRGWHKASPFDTEPLISEIAYALDANENAKILVRLHVNPPYWWLRDHPEECAVYRTEDGDTIGIDDGENERLIANDGSCHLRVSLASEVWKQEAGKCLEIFLEGLKADKVGDSVIAIQVACGMFGEWHHWACLSDVSLPAETAFKKYLKEKYPAESQLKTAWNDPAVTYETAYYTPEDFAKSGDGGFRNPALMQNTIDSQKCNQKIVIDAIEHFAKIVKKAVPDTLCGSFYAYYFFTGESRRPVSGHLCDREILSRDSAVDFLCGPFPYYKQNRAPDGVPMQRALLESMRLNKKLWITEMDQHPAGTESIIGGDPNRFDETTAMLWRNALQPLLAGEGFWYYDHRVIPSLIPENSKNPSAGSIYRKNGWWNTPQLMEEIKKIQNFAKMLAEKPYTKAADVLVVYDTESFYYRNETNQFAEEYRLLASLSEYGAVYDCIYSGDVDKCEADTYKCVIFANSHKITPEQREMYKKLFSDALVIYMNGYGYCDGKTLDEKNISGAVGLTLEKTDAQYFVSGCDKIKLETAFLPAFAVLDDDAKPLAYYDGGAVAAAVKENTAYVQLPYLTKDIADYLLKYAGVHSWCDSGEPVIAGNGYMAINCQHAGERNVFLPGGKAVKIKTDGFETVIFDLEKGERI